MANILNFQSSLHIKCHKTDTYIFPFASRHLEAEFYNINDLGQEFGGLKNKALYTGFESIINRDIYSSVLSQNATKFKPVT